MSEVSELSRGIKFDESTSRKVEQVYLTPDVIAQRQRTHELLALAPGEQVLDIGSGPGLLAYEMAEAVGPTGRVSGIDASPDMLTMSTRRCAEQSWVDFQEADATKLPFPDAAFDAAVSTQVYEYVADVPAASRELHRTLRPGGRALVIDSDWHSIAIHSDDGERMSRVLSAWDEHFVHPRLPRTLGAELRTAGFTIEQREVIPLLNAEYRDDTYAKPTLAIMASFVVGRGGITQAEADAWHAEFATLGEQGRFFFCINRYVFLAQRPVGASAGASGDA